VLQAVGAQPWGHAHLRLTLSRYTTDEEVDQAGTAFVSAVTELRR
jgi:cysteine sulfinate desulfinase/cysteine desulfurase-like protein